MTRFPAHAKMQGHACSFLDELTSLPALIARVAAAGARAALAAALLAYPDDVDVQGWGVKALARLPPQ